MKNLIIAKEDVMTVNNTYPVVYNPTEGLLSTLERAFQEIASELKARAENKHLDKYITLTSYDGEKILSSRVLVVLNTIYNGHKTEEEATMVIGFRSQWIHQIHIKTINSLMNGDTICGDIKLKDELVNHIHSIRKGCLYKTAANLSNVLGGLSDELLDILGFDVVDLSFLSTKDEEMTIIPEETLVVRIRQKAKYIMIAKALIVTLRDLSIPMSKDEIMKALNHHPTIINLKDGYDQEFIDSILSLPGIVDKENGLYCLNTKFLVAEQQRIARIIYDNCPIDDRSIQRKYMELYGDTPKIYSSRLKDKYNMFNFYGGFWTVKGKEPVYPAIHSEALTVVERSGELSTTSKSKEIVRCEETKHAPYNMDWGTLKDVLKSELSFYQNWMAYEGIDYNEAIEKFVQFIKGAGNVNLNKYIPHNLCRYWLSHTDKFDRSSYVNLLAAGFEGLLAEISLKNNGYRKSKNGLIDWLKDEYNHFLPLTTTHRDDAQGFDRIFIELKCCRNKFCHGGFAEMNSAYTNRSISNFVALYVYTVAKYAA